MLAADIVKHPEYETVVWDLKPAQSGKVAVAKNRWGPINIAYEIHGVGSTKLVVCHWILGFIFLKRNPESFVPLDPTRLA